MHKVAEGWFLSGCADAPPGITAWDLANCAQTNPLRRLWISAFEVDELEVTRGAYARCVNAEQCSPSLWKPTIGDGDGDEYPVLVRYEQAESYCRWLGKRLPTEAEWEKAARGTDGRMYPWGNDRPTCETAALAGDAAEDHPKLRCKGYIAPAGAHPLDKSPYGALDMAGNVAEWTSDLNAMRKGLWTALSGLGEFTFADPTIVDPLGPTRGVIDRLAAIEDIYEILPEHVPRGGRHDAAVGSRHVTPFTLESYGEPNGPPVAGLRCVRSLPNQGPVPEAPPIYKATIKVVGDKDHPRVVSTAAPGY